MTTLQSQDCTCKHCWKQKTDQRLLYIASAIRSTTHCGIWGYQWKTVRSCWHKRQAKLTRSTRIPISTLQAGM